MSSITLKSGTKLPLMNLKGKDYLQVAYRLVWFREEHSDWSIETEFLNQSDQSAVCRATIKDALGRTIATSHKEESSKDFAMGHREKAETGAIGRALALCGYGTQFEPEFDEGDRVVDSPMGSKHAVAPEQPPEGTGHIPDQYVIPFGKWRMKSLEQIMRDEGPDAISGYIQYLEDSAIKQNKPIQGQVQDFITRAAEFLGSWENQK
jgi:hypothetical protein